MAYTNDAVVRKGWDVILDSRIDLLKKVSAGSRETLEAIKIADQLSEVDYTRTFLNKARRLRNAGEAMRGFDALEQRALKGTEDANDNYAKVRKDMDDFKDTEAGQTKEGWEDELDATIDEQKKKSDELWEKLRSDGKDIIRQMPEDLRDAAAHAYGGALGAIAEFFRNAMDWLRNAFQTILEWFKKAWEKVKEWANKAASWFVGAWNTVKSWFGARGLSITPYSDWFRLNWVLGDDEWKPTAEWVSRDFNISHYRLYKQQVTVPFTYELGIRVAGMSSPRTYEFAVPENEIYTKTALWNGDWSIGFNHPSEEPRVVEIRTQGD